MIYSCAMYNVERTCFVSFLILPCVRRYSIVTLNCSESLYCNSVKKADFTCLPKYMTYMLPTLLFTGLAVSLVYTVGSRIRLISGHPCMVL